jgi:hypothetical protein
VTKHRFESVVMADSKSDYVLAILRASAVLLSVPTVVVGLGGQRTAIVVVGIVVLVASLLALTGVYVISSSRTFWLAVAISLVTLIGLGILFPAVPSIGIPAGR